MRALLAILICGCFSPDIGEGALACGDHNLCPEGFSCAGGHCYQNPPPIDAPTIDAFGSCTPGVFQYCEGPDGGHDNLYHCSSDGTRTESEPCDFGCNINAGQCNLCTPSESSCDAQGRLVVCASNGLSQSRTMCVSDNNDCTDDLCTGGGCTHRNVTDGTTCTGATGGSTGACLAGVCVCGDMGEPCCNGTTCNSSLQCIGNRCGNCGSPGQSCCTGQSCGPGAVCISNMCNACGRDTQPCCGGSMCDSGNNCTNSTCHACGGANQTCCQSTPLCSGTLGCVQNMCQCIPDCSGRACGADDGCGHACQVGSCSQSNTHCVAGQCVCDMVSCNGGCCSNNTCQPGTQTQACGSGGRQCQQCMGLALCVGQVCQL